MSLARANISSLGSTLDNFVTAKDGFLSFNFPTGVVGAVSIPPPVLR